MQSEKPQEKSKHAECFLSTSFAETDILHQHMVIKRYNSFTLEPPFVLKWFHKICLVAFMTQLKYIKRSAKEGTLDVWRKIEFVYCVLEQHISK